MFRQTSLIFMCAVFCFAEVYAAGDVLVRGRLNEIKLDTPVETLVVGGGNNADYIAAGDTLIVNLKNTGRMEIVLPKPLSAKYTVSDAPRWQFYGDTAYAARSGSAAIHRGEIFLPDCMGNICRKDSNFSVRIPSVQEPADLRFALDGEDVSTFFHYEDDSFKIKEFYQEAFFKLFKSDTALFTWDDGKVGGSLTLRTGNKTIQGKLSGIVLPEVTLEFAGSELAAPHSFSVKVAPDGSFSADGLVSFEYAVRAGALPLSLKPDNLTTDEDGQKLLLNIFVPKYDYLLQSPPRSYTAGEFILLNLKDWHKNLTGRIAEFTQISGDEVLFKAHPSFVAMVLPEISLSGEDLLFQGKAGGKTFLLSMPNPARKPQIYEHFSLFSEEGRYARTGFTESAGGVLLRRGQKIITAYVNTVSAVDADSIRVHLYTANRTYDVTRRFSWKATTQSVSSLPEYHGNLYNALAGEPGSLAVTFCDKAQPEQCFRIYEELRPGVADVVVKLSAQRNYTGMKLILRELDLSHESIVRTIPLKNAVSYRFSGLPAGEYQAILADPGLRIYGSAFIKVDGEGSNQVSLRVRSAAQATEEMITAGNVISLPEITLYQNDYRVINTPLRRVDAVRLLGDTGGDYVLYSDGSLAFHTYEDNKNSGGTLVLEGDGRYALLPVKYRGTSRMIYEKGMDYSMCPPERPLCRNAFVEVLGVEQGVYDGAKPLVFIMPFIPQAETFSVMLTPSSDMSEMFEVNQTRRTIALKKEYIPAFLSAVSQSAHPLILKAGNREYWVNLVAGFKSVEAAVVNPTGGRSQFFAGMAARISCVHGQQRVFSRKAEVNKDGFLLFKDLPNCVYRMELVDKDRLFSGSLDNLTLATGQNMIRTVFPVSCIGSNDQFIENCRPFLPIISDNRLISPDFGVILTDSYLEGSRSVSVEGTNALEYRLLGNGLTLFAPRGTEGSAMVNIKGEDKFAQLPLRVETIHGRLVRVMLKPADTPDPQVRLTGLTASFVYAGSVPLSLSPDLPFDYHPEEVFADIGLEDNRPDISHMFEYRADKQELTLKSEYIGEFYRLLGSKQREVVFNFAPFDTERHYVISVVVAAPAASIFVEAVSPLPLTKTAGALLAGRKGNNNFEYRQYSAVRGGKVSFGMVPLGTYDVLVFDTATGQFGAREISIQTPQDIDIEIALRQFK